MTVTRFKLPAKETGDYELPLIFLRDEVYVAQAGPELGSSDHLASAFQVCETSDT